MVKNRMELPYFLLVVAVLFASLNSVVLHKAAVNSKKSIYKLNLIASLSWCVILFAANGFSLTLSRSVLFWGVLYGAVQALFVFFKAAAMSAGPVAITTIIGNSSLILSILVSYIAWGEPVSLLQGVGVVLLFCGVYLCTYKKSEESYQKSWKFLVIFFLFFAFLVGITFKAFARSGNGDLAGDMMLVSALTMTVSFGLMTLLSRKDGERCDKRFLIYAILSGLLSCGYNRLNIYTSGVIDAIIFFPCFNGGVIVVSGIMSVISCRERLTVKQVLGLALGTAAICIIGIF